MICNEWSERLEQALASLVGCFDQSVLVATTTDPIQLAHLAAGCEKYGVVCYALKDTAILDDQNRLLDFAAARNESWGYLATDWGFWLDADDLLEDGAKLRDLIEEAPPTLGGFWLPYIYATDEHGNATTVHSRERLVRMSYGWHWTGRLHETLAPAKPVQWAKSADCVVRHQGGYDDHGERNLKLLNLMYADDPNDVRIWLYMGHQHFAERLWDAAIAWYTRFFSDPRGFPLERWQAMGYAARALREQGKYSVAIKLDTAAMFDRPDLADSYLGIAESYLKLGQWEKAIQFAEMGLTKDQPNDLVFVNYLDYTFRPASILNAAYAMVGDLEKALEWAKKGLELRPDQKELLTNVQLFEAGIHHQQAIDAYTLLAPGLSDSERVRVARGLPGKMFREPAIRDVWVPAQMRLIHNRGTQPTVDIFCGTTFARWAAPTPAAEGIGGSETAVVEIAKRLHKDGWRVQVFGRPDELEGMYDGVAYLDSRRYRLGQATSDLLVVWRRPDFPIAEATAKEKWQWCHDLNNGSGAVGKLGVGYDRIFGVSAYHANYLHQRYGVDAGVLPNGVDLSRFARMDIPRQRYKCVYTSSPDRGLLHLLRMWPALKAVEPTAELHVYYGWDNIDRAIAQGDTGLAAFKALVTPLLRQPGVVWHGRTSQDELAKELLSADLWLHPTSYLETFCISAVEAMAAGLYPITSSCGAIPDVIGSAFPLVPGRAGSPAYNKQWMGLALAFLINLNVRVEYYGRGKAQAKGFTWDRAYESWQANLKQAVAA